jgi:hypothetical protein
MYRINATSQSLASNGLDGLEGSVWFFIITIHVRGAGSGFVNNTMATIASSLKGGQRD